MGGTAQIISKVENKDELINLLNCAFAEEWLAYYQYWVGAKVARGLERPKIVEEFIEHATEELKHADWLADRIIQLGATPIIDPDEWKINASCKYDAPVNGDTKILHQTGNNHITLCIYSRICLRAKKSCDSMVL
jgi:ferritin-like protein